MANLVPVANNAQYLEVQVWYPVAIIPIRSGDMGYRYQLELDIEGASENDGRILAGNNSMLSVESLGVRIKAASLPVLG